MKLNWKNRTLFEFLAIVAATIVVVVLGLLQYQWTGEISRNDEERLQASLASGVANFEQQFSYDFERLCEAFLIPPEPPAPNIEVQVSSLYRTWIRSTSVPGMVVGLYVYKTLGSQAPSLEIVDQDEDRASPAMWPAEFSGIRAWISRQSSSGLGDREAVYYPWTFVDDAPALVRPLFEIPAGKERNSGEVLPSGYLIIQLSRTFLEQHYFPEMVERHFGESGERNFDVAIRSAQPPYEAVYSTRPDLATASIASPDAQINLLEPVSDEARRRGRPPLLAASPAREWQLLVQHPGGPMETSVTSWRRRSLAISFTLLAVLAGSSVLIVFVARRAERLARLQIEFVSGVSHELCTPLAVINSAAENLADGVVNEPAQAKEYGGLIRDQGRRLERMVDEVLLFAAERSGRAQYEPRPLEVAEVLDRSLHASEPVLREAGFTVEKKIGSDLPLVVADPAAVERCLNNLLSNAIKYSTANRWIGVRAEMAAAVPPEVQVSVEDKGMGIPANELPHVFEPFYRVRSARESQAGGVGLGLYLVKRMMEAMGGRVTVSSEVGRGSLFVLHFPTVANGHRPAGGG